MKVRVDSRWRWRLDGETQTTGRRQAHREQKRKDVEANVVSHQMSRIDVPNDQRPTRQEKKHKMSESHRPTSNNCGLGWRPPMLHY